MAGQGDVRSYEARENQERKKRNDEALARDRRFNAGLRKSRPTEEDLAGEYAKSVPKLTPKADPEATRGQMIKERNKAKGL